MNTLLLKRACRLLAVWGAIAQARALADAQPIEVRIPVRKTPVSFARDVQPFLEDRCVGCHGSALAEHRLNMETVAGMIKGGKRGPSIKPGKGDESLILKMAARRMTPAMPPIDKPANRPLEPEQLGLLKLWIDEGAHDDSPAEPVPEPTLSLSEPPAAIRSINAVDLTADGARLAAGVSNKIQIHDVDSGLEIVALDAGKDLVQSLRYSPDSSILAAGGYQAVTLWSAPTGGRSAVYKGHSAAVAAIAQAADRLYSGGLDKTIRAWKSGDGTLLQTWPQPAAVRSLVVSSDGKSLFAGYDDGVLRRIDATNGKEQSLLKGQSKAVIDLALLAGSKDVVRLAFAGLDGTAGLWVIPSSTKPDRVIPLESSKVMVRAVVAVHEGKLVATAGDDGVVRLYHGETGALVKTVATGRARPIRSLAASREGLLLAGFDDGVARLITLSEGKLVHELTGLKGSVRAAAFSPRGDRLATTGDSGGVKIWDTASGAGVIAFGSTPPTSGKPAPFERVAFASDGEIVTAAADGGLARWSFTGSWGVIRTLGPHRFRVLALDFSPDGTLLATGGGEPSASGEVMLWEVGKGLLARRWDSLHSDTVLGLRFSPDGTRLATASADKFVKVITLADGKLARSFEGHTHHVLGVDWQADGKRLVSAGADSVLKLWDYESGDQIRTLQGPKKQVTAVRWLAGGPEIVAASGDGQTRGWSPDNPNPRRSFAGPKDYILTLAVSAAGARLAAGCADGTIYAWDGKTGRLIRSITPR